MAPPFRRLELVDKTLLALQENAGRCLDVLLSFADVDRRVLEDMGDGRKQGIALSSSGTTLVPHGLNRTWRFWRVVGLSANAVVYEDTAASQPKDRFLALKCSANCTVKLEVW
jgi:hypothetical protein